MRYNDKVFTTNEKGVNEQIGYRLELDYKEFETIIESLEIVKDADDMPTGLYEKASVLSDKFFKVPHLSEDNHTNYDV